MGCMICPEEKKGVESMRNERNVVEKLDSLDLRDMLWELCRLCEVSTDDWGFRFPEDPTGAASCEFSAVAFVSHEDGPMRGRWALCAWYGNVDGDFEDCLQIAGYHWACLEEGWGLEPARYGWENDNDGGLIDAGEPTERGLSSPEDIAKLFVPRVGEWLSAFTKCCFKSLNEKG